MCIPDGYNKFHAIMDPLDAFAFKLSVQARMGNTSYHTYAERLFRPILDVLYDASFVNMNLVKTNYPGIDLYDRNLDIGIQLTSKADNRKISNTIEKIKTQMETDSNYPVSNATRVIIFGISGDDIKLPKKWTTETVPFKLDFLNLIGFYHKLGDDVNYLDKVEKIRTIIDDEFQSLSIEMFQSQYGKKFEMLRSTGEDFVDYLLKISESSEIEREELKKFVDLISSMSSNYRSLYAKIVEYSVAKAAKLNESKLSIDVRDILSRGIDKNELAYLASKNVVYIADADDANAYEGTFAYEDFVWGIGDYYQKNSLNVIDLFRKLESQER